MAFTIKVNDGGADDTDAWEADYGAEEIVGISVQSAGGEVARLQVDNASSGIRLEVIRRNNVDSTYLDIEEQRRRQERGEKIEEANTSLVSEGRSATDDEERPLTAPSEGGFTGSPESEAAVNPASTSESSDSLSGMTKAELQSYADSNSIEGVNQESMTKDEMLAKIRG